VPTYFYTFFFDNFIHTILRNRLLGRPQHAVVHYGNRQQYYVSYKIFDLLGNLVDSGLTYSEIDISSLLSGSYLLMVQDKGMLRTGKIQVVK
jgi:hypothetical protein